MVAPVNTSNGPTRSRACTPSKPTMTTDRFMKSVFATTAVASMPRVPQIRTHLLVGDPRALRTDERKDLDFAEADLPTPPGEVTAGVVECVAELHQHVE